MLWFLLPPEFVFWQAVNQPTMNFFWSPLTFSQTYISFQVNDAKKESRQSAAGWLKERILVLQGDNHSLDKNGENLYKVPTIFPL